MKKKIRPKSSEGPFSLPLAHFITQTTFSWCAGEKQAVPSCHLRLKRREKSERQVHFFKYMIVVSSPLPSAALLSLGLTNLTGFPSILQQERRR